MRGFWGDQVDIIAKQGQAWYNVLDVGSFKGNTVAKYRELLPEAHIYAFEPLPDQVSALQARFKRDKNVHVFQVAMSDTDGTAPFFVGGSGGSESSLFTRPVEGRRYYLSNLKPSGPVQTVTLDSWMDQQHIGHVNILKADVHGAFPKIVQGGHQAFSQQLVDVIGVEVYFVPMFKGNYVLHELTALLEGYSYSLYCLYDFLRDRESGQLKVGNAIYVSERIRRTILDNFPPGWTMKGG